MHDMNKMQNEDKTQPRRESHNLKPKMARVGVTNIASYIRGVTVLQKPSEEWVNWKSHAPQQIGDEAHSFSHSRIGEILRLGFAVEGG